MLARLKVLLVRLALDMVAILIDVISKVAGSRACRPNLILFATTTAFEVLADHDESDRHD